MELGLGGGWNDGGARGVRHPVPADRRAVRACSRTSSRSSPGCGRRPTGERFDYTGTQHTIVDSPALPKPVQRPRPPIIIGGYGAKRTPALAAQYADEFNLPFPPLDYYRPACDVVRAACEAAGRDPASMRYTVARRRVCRPRRGRGRATAAAIGRTPDDLRANAAGRHSPTRSSTASRAFGDAGAETVYFQVLDLDDLDHLRLVAAEVAPHL